MRAKYLTAALLASFVVVALVTIGRDALRATPPPAPAATSASVAAAVPGTVLQTAKPEPASPAPAAQASPRDVPQPRPAATERRSAAGRPAANVEVAAATPRAPERRVVATYFHGDVRCATCLKLEAYAKEAVESAFPEAIARGEVEFRAVNVDRPENRHFIEDFQLTNKTVVVTEELDGKVERHVKLDDVWRLVGNHDAYLLYVQDAVRAYREHV